VSRALSSLTDQQLSAVVAGARPLGQGIGGRSAELDVGGTRVFVKRVPLTDLERAHPGSTANLFDLPLCYQYGIGSAGFGAWRELAAHRQTTEWVLTGAYAGFPVMYHWRVLPDSPPDGFVDEFGGIDGAVAYWDGSPAVRARLTAISRAAASVVIFLEHVPHTLADWQGDRDWVDGALARGTAFMSSRRFVHFDAHFGNILTNGEMVYFADFGLALSAAFDLSAEEVSFLTNHLAYDRACTVSQLRSAGPHAALAAAMDAFHRRLRTESKQTPFPAAEIERLIAGG